MSLIFGGAQVFTRRSELRAAAAEAGVAAAALAALPTTDATLVRPPGAEAVLKSKVGNTTSFAIFSIFCQSLAGSFSAVSAQTLQVNTL